jgi:hypothetical protein
MYLLGDLVVHKRMALNWNFKKQREGTAWIHVAKYMSPVRGVCENKNSVKDAVFRRSTERPSPSKERNRFTYGF